MYERMPCRPPPPRWQVGLSQGSTYIVLFTPGERAVRVGGVSDFHAIYSANAAGKIWHMVDGRGGNGRPCRMRCTGTAGYESTLLAATGPGIRDSFRKGPDAREVFMPPWGWAELEALRRMQGGKVSAAQLKGLVRIFGGVPRTVLDRAATWQESLKELSDSLWAAPLPTITYMEGQDEAGGRATDKIIHTQVRAKYYYVICSAVRPRVTVASVGLPLKT